MRAIIWGAVLGTVVLAGCQTGGAGAMRQSSEAEGRIAQNPWSLERAGFTINGTVTDEFSDMLVVKDKWGENRHLRIDEQTRYYQDGKQIARELLAPGSTVRASYDEQDRGDRVAREIIVVEDVGQQDPLDVPDRPHSLR
jgi:hypothetical protein